ncbi:permease [Phaeobacter sp.]|uniref:permease n=1 Tax=Phaeobacter sp. TaxID=1902409 RepID=UPI0025D7091E|nr:permease [Phaeobacter sp.]
MTEISDHQPSQISAIWSVLRQQMVWLASLAIFALLAVIVPAQAYDSGQFVAAAILSTGPYLLFSILVAAWAGATGADSLIAKAFTGAPLVMIALGAVAGGISPFCSCGVIPLIAALLSMGVPLSAVMAFWLASPIMDPSMFLLTTGVLGFEFALAKTFAAIGLGLFGGLVAHVLAGSGALKTPLRDGVGNGGCGAANLRNPGAVHWRFWNEADRRRTFLSNAFSTTAFLTKWLVLAFLLESLMTAWIPAETVTQVLGGTGVLPILSATLVGVPAYLNGYAALPLVNGLIEQGMAPGAGLAFLVAGGVTSIPAAMAVWALARWPVFLLYIGLSLGGAFTIGLLFQAWQYL